MESKNLKNSTKNKNKMINKNNPDNKKKSNNEPLFLVLLALVFGAITGFLTQNIQTFISFYDLIGTLFINSLMLIVIPLITSSIITSICQIGGDSSIGRIGIKIFSFFVLLNFLAIFVGFLTVNIFDDSLKNLALSLSNNITNIPISSPESFGFSSIILKFIPPNLFQALSQGQLIGVIFFCIFFGFAITKLEDSYQKTLLSFWKGTFSAMLKMTTLLMKMLPIGVFCLIAKQFATSGLSQMTSLFTFIAILFFGFFLFVVVIIPTLLKFVGRVSPIRHFKAMLPALVTGFSTSSSSATLPVTLECLEKRAKVSNKIASLVLPMATSLNMAGSALFAYITSIFIAYIYNVPLSMSTLLSTLFLSLILSFGVAGIPSGCLVLVIVIIKSFGIPPEAIGLFLAIDRILDMFRTAINVLTGSCSTVLVAKMENEKDVLTNRNFSNN